MNEPVSPDPQMTGEFGSGLPHGGQAIRAAREARGQTLLHLSILLKITERRLQAFEEGRWDEVGDRTFVRALAQSLCRHLELDARPVLAALPAASVEPRQQPERGRLPELNVPALKTLRRPVRLPGMSSGTGWITPVRLGVVVILSGALGLALAPSHWWSAPGTTTAVGGMAFPTPTPAPDLSLAGAASEPVAPPDTLAVPQPASGLPGASGTAAMTVPASPGVAPPVAAASPTPAATTPSAQPSVLPASAPSSPVDVGNASLQIRATQDTWIQVTDAKGQVLLSRLMRSGERAGLDGARPLRMRVGNVAGTEAVWLGRRVVLDESQRNNVADVELP